MPPLLLIPARYAATRLPGKPLADIHGKPMIVRVWERAVAANAGPVAVATDTESIADAIRAAGGTAVMTRADHPSGSDRIHEALQILDPQAKHGTVINLQGDMPTLDPAVVARVLSPLSNPAADIATLAAKIREERERADPAVVKVALAAPQMTEDGDWMMENPASAQRAL